MAQIYQADLATIGVDVTLKPLQPAVFLAARNNRSWQGQLLSVNTLGAFQPASQMSGGTYGPVTNFAGFRDSAYDELANRIRPKRIQLEVVVHRAKMVQEFDSVWPRARSMAVALRGSSSGGLLRWP
jgi:hypothetical protein